jgi:hypothetical protein
MAQCEETKKVRSIEKGSGRIVSKYVPICALEAETGGKYCPRHAFLNGVKAEADRAKDVQAHINHNVSQRGQGMPKTRAELIERGYQFTGTKECYSCGAPIEWWRTPNERSAPYNPMPELTSHATSHFATCKHAAQHRKAS